MSRMLQRYWVDSPDKFRRRIHEIVSQNAGLIEAFELCRSASGLPVPGYRIGRGPHHAVLLGRVHGHEPSGTCGLTALLEGLAVGKSPDRGDPFPQARDILDRLTLHVFPMVNPSAAERYSSRIPDSYIGGLAAEARRQGRFEEWLHEGYEAVLHEPGLLLKKRRPPFFTEQELQALAESGKVMGTLFTEDGVELWKDWVNERAPQTRALKRYLEERRPILMVDVHNDSPPTRICPPSAVEERDAEVFQKLGSALYASLGEASIDAAGKVEPYLRIDENKSVCWAYENFGTIQFLYEVNGLGPRDHMVLAVWYGITALLIRIAPALGL